MTKTQMVSYLAEQTGLTKVQVDGFMDAFAKLAYQEAKNGFAIHGIGKLVLVNRKARVGRNPATGAEVQIPAKTVVKFRVAKVCKDSVLSA